MLFQTIIVSLKLEVLNGTQERFIQKNVKNHENIELIFNIGKLPTIFL